MKIRRWVFDEDAFNDDKTTPLQIILAIILFPFILVASILALPFIYIVKFIKGLK